MNDSPKPFATPWREPECDISCQHPPEKVVADVLEGDVPGTAVQWCKVCGAVRIVRPA